MPAVNLLDPSSLLQAFGVAGIFVVLFVETGLLIGFFLPGDSLLFTAGLLSAAGAAAPVQLPLGWVLVASAAGALLGAQAGYVLGRVAGPRLLDRPEHPRLHHGVERARAALERYGPARAIVLARFVPLVRTVLNPLAGAVRLDARLFTVWQVVGGLGWTAGLVLLGHLLGSQVPGIDRYLLPVVAVAVVLTLIPMAREILRRPGH